MKYNFPKNPVVYFVAEYALRSDAPTYAGGLGVLAGDYILEAGKENFPFILVSLRYGGYDAASDGYEIITDEKGQPIKVQVEVGKRKIYACAWVKFFGPETSAILIDPDIAENTAEDRLIANKLYDPRFYTRMRQEFLLGAAALEFFSRLHIEPTIFHLNEGHMTFSIFAIVASEIRAGAIFEKALERAKEKIVFSKHTILSEAGTYIPSNEFFDFVSLYCATHAIDPRKIFELGEFEKDNDMFSTTKLGIMMSVRKNAVSKIHQEKELAVHPGTGIEFVTNGIFKDRWRSSHISKDTLTSDEKLWNSKCLAKKEMLDFVQTKIGVALDPAALTIVWARRFAAYKRPELLFSDASRLEKILSNAKHPVSIIISGKAHSADEESQKIVALVRSLIAEKRFQTKVAYIPDYSLDIAKTLASGADLWLNTPKRGFEACGTSGMKAGLNGTLMCSISDGWMDEVDWKGIGWILPEEKTADALYDLLEKEIVPAFFNRTEWISRMKKTVAVIETRFGADRMLADYRKKMYHV